MSRSLEQLYPVKIVEGEGETFDSEFPRDGVEFFGIPIGRESMGVWAHGRSGEGLQSRSQAIPAKSTR
jgi:hypothetical protein